MKQQRIATAFALIGLMTSAAMAQDEAPVATDSLAGIAVQNSVIGPIGFAGSMTSRVNNAHFFNAPNFAAPYVDRILPYGGLNMKMVANPNPAMRLSTVMGVGTNFNGMYRNENANKSQVNPVFDWGTTPDTTYYFDQQRALYVHNNEREATTIMEELIASADIRTKAFKMEVQAGSAIWVEQSPLTIYRRDNRNRSSFYYETYEPEYSAATFYNYKLLNRLDWGGQPVWPRKTFGGVMVDMYELPAGLTAKFMIAEPANARPLEKRGNLMADWGDREALSAVSHPGWMYTARVANSRLPGLYMVDPTKGQSRKMIAGVNLVWSDFHDDIIQECTPSNFGAKCLANSFRHMTTMLQANSKATYTNMMSRKGITSDVALGNFLANSTAYSADAMSKAYSTQPFYAEPRTVSVDVKGNLNPKHFIQGELGLAWADTTEFSPIYADGTAAQYAYSPTLKAKLLQPNAAGDAALAIDPKNTVFAQRKVSASKGLQNLAFYGKSFNEGWLIPYSAEVAFIGQDFDSPWGMTEYAVPIPVDEMVVGSGTMQYRRNQMGFNIMVMPRRLNGYSRITFGQYFQVNPTQDVLRFQHNLIGRDLWKSTFSWSRFDPTMPFDQGHANNTGDRVMLRAGDVNDATRPQGFGEQIQGGYVGDDNQLWERFAFYDDKTVAAAKDKYSKALSIADLEASVDEAAAYIPESSKASGTLAWDFGYYLSPMLNMSEILFGNLYLEANAVNPGFAVPLLPGNMFNQMMAKAELVWGVHRNFYVVGTAGFETMKADNTLRNGVIGNGGPQSADYLERPINDNGDYEAELYYSPIDYKAWTAGIGFDWDFSQRAGLHMRYKFVQHTDTNVDSFNEKLDSWMAAGGSESGNIPKAQTWRAPTSYSMGHIFAETKVWF